MADLISLVGRIRAFAAGHAVRIASHLQVGIQPHALIICPLAMAGEDTTIHAVAIGEIGRPPQIRVVPDPRVRNDHYALIAWLGEIIEAYYGLCCATDDFPQIWVSSGAAAGHLDTLADRLRFTRDNPPIRRLGELLSYATGRYPIAGQQALVTAAGALCAHFSTGQQEGEDEHLGTVLTWISPPTDHEIHTAVEIAERVPMGVKTDPEFDRDHLQPLLTAYNRCRAEAGSPAQLSRRATPIEEALSPVVGRIYQGVQQAIAHLASRFPPASVLADLARREAYEFASFMKARNQGHFLPYRDRPKAAAFKLAEREEAVQSYESGALYGDDVAQARARLAGHLLTGTVANVSRTPAGRRTIFRFDVETQQSNLRIRRGDELALLTDPRLRCFVTGVGRNCTVTIISLEITAGMRAVGCPDDGSAIAMGPPPPDWSHLGRERQKMSARLATPPWTHGDTVQSIAPPAVERPNDLTAAIEALR
jgi:hypothetical protein